MKRTLVLAAVAAGIAFGSLPRIAAQGAAAINPALYSGLKWRMVGPFRAGRVNAVTGVVGQPNTFYFGSVGGGVWKTTNIGRTWTPIFDSQNVASIGAIAVAPSNPVGRLRRHRRSGHARLDRLRRRHVQVHRRRQDVAAHRARDDAADRQDHRPSARPQDRLRRGARARLRTARRSRRVSIEGRRRELAEGAVQGGRRRRDRSRVRSRATRRRFTPRCGPCGVRHGSSTRRRTDPAAGSTSPRTAGRRGTS